MPGSVPSTVDTALTADKSLALLGEDNYLISTHLPELTTLQPNPFVSHMQQDYFHLSAFSFAVLLVHHKAVST